MERRQASGRGAHGGALQEAAAYHVHLRLQNDAEDRAALGVLEQNYADLQAGLSRRVGHQLGPAFGAQIREIRLDSSVLAIVVVGTFYSVQSSALAPQLASFAATVQEEIAKQLDAFPISEIDVAMEPLGEAAGAEAKASSTWSIMSPILAAIATGIGVVGFATFIGGAIQYGRFAGAGLPAEEAVSVVPTRTFIVLGAKTLTWAAVAGLVAAATVFLWRSGEQAKPEPTGPLQAEKNEWRARALVMLVAIIFLWALDETHLKKPEVIAGLVIGGVLLAWTVGIVGGRTASAFWVAASVFIAVGLFIGALQVAHAWDNRTVRGAALVRNNKKAVIGFYIAESGGRVFLGQMFPDPKRPKFVDTGRSRIIAINTAQVSDLAIGAPKDPEHAQKQAEELADELCRREPAEAVTSTTPPENCWSYLPGGSKTEQQEEKQRREAAEAKQALEPRKPEEQKR